MDYARSAELQVLLEGVPLPVGKRDLLRYARHEGAEQPLLAALARVPDRRYDNLDEVGEEIAAVQPPRRREEPHSPRGRSGLPPGGPEYTNPRPESGFVRERGPES